MGSGNMRVGFETQGWDFFCLLIIEHAQRVPDTFYLFPDVD